MVRDEKGAKDLLEGILAKCRSRAGRARAGSRSRRGRPQALLSAAPRRALRLAGRGRTAGEGRPGARLDASRERLRRRERRAVAGGPRDERARVSRRRPRGEGRGRDACRRARRFVRLRQRREAGRAGHEAPRGASSGRRSRSINLGVPGYGTDQALLTLRRWGPRLAPDIVLAGFFWNDVMENASAEDVQHAEAPFRPRGGLSVARARRRGDPVAVARLVGAPTFSGPALISGPS